MIISFYPPPERVLIILLDITRGLKKSQKVGGGSRKIQQITPYKITNLFSWFLNKYQTFLFFLLEFCTFFVDFCTKFIGVFSIQGLTNRRFGSIIRYPAMGFKRFEGLGIGGLARQTLRSLL
jgi:hypothetical protein